MSQGCDFTCSCTASGCCPGLLEELVPAAACIQKPAAVRRTPPAEAVWCESPGGSGCPGACLTHREATHATARRRAANPEGPTLSVLHSGEVQHISLTCWLLLAGVCGAWLLASMELVAATASLRPRWRPLSWQWRWRKREKAAYMSCAGARARYRAASCLCAARLREEAWLSSGTKSRCTGEMPCREDAA